MQLCIKGKSTACAVAIVESLSNYDDHHNDDFKKTIGSEQQLWTCITLFSTFLWRPLHDYDLKPPILTFYRGRGQNDDEFSFLFLNLNKILKNSTSGKVACIWHIERVQIDAIKFESTEIHFFTDVFTAVVVVLVKVPSEFTQQDGREKRTVSSL